MNMQLYELLFIIKNDFSDEQIPAVVKETTEMLDKKAGNLSIKAQQLMGRKRFTYPIKHDLQGYYVLIDFEADTKDIAKFNRLLELHDKILRHIIVKKEIKTPAQIAKEVELKNTMHEKPAGITASRDTAGETADGSRMVQKQEDMPTKSKKTTDDIEKLDEKLDEILKRDIV